MNPYYFNIVVSDEQPSPPKRTRTAATSATSKSATPLHEAKTAASKPLKAASQATSTSAKSVTTKSATKKAAENAAAAATTQGTSQAEAGNLIRNFFEHTVTI